MLFFFQYGGKDYVAYKVYVYSVRRDLRITALCGNEHLSCYKQKDIYLYL